MKDVTPDGFGKEYWTVALVTPEGEGYPKRETHFGVFTFDDAMIAIDSGKVKTMPDETLELRRIRRFPA